MPPIEQKCKIVNGMGSENGRVNEVLRYNEELKLALAVKPKFHSVAFRPGVNVIKTFFFFAPDGTFQASLIFVGNSGTISSHLRASFSLYACLFVAMNRTF